MNTGYSFGERLQLAFDHYGQLCLGIDAHPQVLSFHGLPDTAEGAETLANRVYDAARGTVGVFKVQVALFERFGAAGYLALERFFARVRSDDTLLIADVKRGEIGTSMAGYAQAWLGNDSALAADAITVNPYLGVRALQQTCELALNNGRGIFVLAANSNPESAAMQRSGNPSIAARVVSDLAGLQRQLVPAASGIHSFGVVIGATVQFEDYGISKDDLLGMPILAPGFGHQGAQISELGPRFGALTNQVLVAQSRSLLMVPFPELPTALQAEQSRIRETVDELQ